MEAVKEKVTFKKYPAYKESGVEYLGDIPAEWDTAYLGSVIEPKTDKGHPNYEVLSVYRDYGVIPKDSRDDNHNATALDTSNYKAVEPGDLVVNKMKAWQGSMGISDYKGIVSPAYITCKVRKDDFESKYLHYLLRCQSYIGEYNRLSYGVRIGQWDMHYEDFKKVTVLIPSPTEQIAIANFLDFKTAKIDEAIEIKEQQIERLKERREILIYKAVTRGLNPDAPLKPSGVEWIGEIPEHWSLTKLRQCLEPVSVKNRPGLQLLSITREEGVIIRDVDDLESNHNYIPDDLSGYKVIREGQFGMNKMKAWQGSYGVSEFDGLVSPAYYVFDLIKDINPDFFHLAIRSSLYVSFFGAASDGVRIGQWDLNKSRMKDIPFVVPTESEQREIVDFISKENEKTFKTIADLEKQIEKLEEYKTTLINSAVTGKIKVV